MWVLVINLSGGPKTTKWGGEEMRQGRRKAKMGGVLMKGLLLWTPVLISTRRDYRDHPSMLSHC